MNKQVTIIDSNKMDWTSVFTEELQANYNAKPLIEDQETGTTIMRVQYPAGFMNKTHDHPCAHGMFILSGILHTSEGDFEPGTFVWFPEGTVMWHGATVDQAVDFIFVTNKKFAINYL